MKIFSLALCIICWGYSSAQNYILESDPAEVLSIVGSSSLHDWTVNAGEVNNLPLEMTLNDKTIDLKAVEISIPIATLDGGRGATMNGKIQKALLATEHPNVIFKLDGAQVVNIADTTSIAGKLIIAGQTVSVDLDLAISSDGEQITLSGNEPMKMTDFGIEPPSALFGQIQTKDDISVAFELKYKLEE
jgi:polyisoprenoid-binding protein YceI